MIPTARAAAVLTPSVCRERGVADRKGPPPGTAASTADRLTGGRSKATFGRSPLGTPRRIEGPRHGAGRPADPRSRAPTNSEAARRGEGLAAFELWTAFPNTMHKALQGMRRVGSPPRRGGDASVLADGQDPSSPAAMRSTAVAKAARSSHHTRCADSWQMAGGISIAARESPQMRPLGTSEGHRRTGILSWCRSGRVGGVSPNVKRSPRQMGRRTTSTCERERRMRRLRRRATSGSRSRGHCSSTGGSAASGGWRSPALG
jgi:hypothetical protein